MLNAVTLVCGFVCCFVQAQGLVNHNLAGLDELNFA